MACIEAMLYRLHRIIHRCILSVMYMFIIGFRTVNGQCSGTTFVYTATDDYQVFTSLNYPFGYGNDQNCLWRIEADNVTDAIRLEITDASIEYHADCVYDYGEVFDGYNTTVASLGKFCGTANPSFVSTNNYMTIAFVSDYSLYSRGFKARYKSGPRWTLVDEEPEEENFSMLAILGVSLGAVVFILVIVALVYTYIQAKKAKELRRHPHARRGLSRVRVEPYDFGGGWTFMDGPAPPAYGEIYSSPMSPPPGYSEVDPNPAPNVPLPGRAEFMAEQPNRHNANRREQAGQRVDTNANTRFVHSCGDRVVRLGGNLNDTLQNAQPQTSQMTLGISAPQTLDPVALQRETNSARLVTATINNNFSLSTSLPNAVESSDNVEDASSTNVEGTARAHTPHVTSTNNSSQPFNTTARPDVEDRSDTSVSILSLPSTSSESTTHESP